MILLVQSNEIPWYNNIFLYLFIAHGILTAIILSYYHKKMRLKIHDNKLQSNQYVAKLDSIRKENTENFERNRLDMLKREDDRNRQWIESEKETLHVLSGVSNLLDLSEKINRVESDKIMKILLDIQSKLEK